MGLKDKVEICIKKIERCQDFDTLFGLEDAFNSIGFTLRETVNHKMALCCIQDGTFASENMLDDFIFVGYSDDSRALLLGEMRGYICEFISEKASNEKLGSPISANKHQQLGVYGRTITQIENEDVLDIMQRMGLEQDQVAEESLLESVRRWLENTDA